MRASWVSFDALRSPRHVIGAARLGRTAARAVSLLLVVCLAAACTHFSPYYRKKLARAVPVAENEQIDHRLLLIGDAGDPDRAGEPTLQLLAHQVALLPERTTVVFLGDNAYERGMPTLEEKSVAEEVGEVV